MVEHHVTEQAAAERCGISVSAAHRAKVAQKAGRPLGSVGRMRLLNHSQEMRLVEVIATCYSEGSPPGYEEVGNLVRVPPLTLQTYML